MLSIPQLKELTKRIRYNIVTSTTKAGSGHPSSSLSAVELTTVLFFGGFFKQDTTDFQSPFNDKFILSKGHAAPLLYSLYEAIGTLTHEELLTLRTFSSPLQGHPTCELPFVDVATGSLGQGLSVGVGMALGLAKKFKDPNPNSNSITPRVFVLLGDSEFAEGQNYEALQIASHYKLNNLIAILDVNRLGQRGETQLGWDTETYRKRVKSFGWNTVVINDGHSIEEIYKIYTQAVETRHASSLHSNNEKPTMFIAKTIKGKGISFMENMDNWHGKAIPENKLEQALKEIGEIDFSIMGKIEKPDGLIEANPKGAKKFGQQASKLLSDFGERQIVQNLASPISTREAYGHALANLAKQNPTIIALDAETSNSTYAEFVKKETPEQFIECFIAEQNMVSMALGLSKVGYIPFASSFAAFLSRAFDQIRMAQYSMCCTGAINHAPTILNIIGSHAGCSIGVDGASQMALEDIAMMRSVRKSTVLYPADAVSAYKLTQQIASRPGINYLRTTREKTPILYGKGEEFPIGGCKIHYCHSREGGSPADNNHFKNENNRLDLPASEDFARLRGDDKQRRRFQALIIVAGITLHEALKAQKQLEEKQIHAIVVDLYSVKPLDTKTIQQLAKQTDHIIVVEDHYEAGGIGEAVASVILGTPTLRRKTPGSNRILDASSSARLTRMTFTHLCVRKTPRSGTPEELLKYEEIDAEAIIKAIKNSCHPDPPRAEKDLEAF